MKKFYAITVAMLSICLNLTSLGLPVIKNSLLDVVNAYEDGSSAADETFSEPMQPRDIALLSLNPGYTVDGIQNVGEYIQLTKLTDTPVSLSGYALRYTNTVGNASDLFVFPEGSYMVGDTLLLRLASAPEASQADLTYTKTLALGAGPLELIYQEEVVDSVCWTGKDACLHKFTNKAGERTSIVQDLGTGEYAHVLLEDYQPVYDPENPGYQAPVASMEEDADPVEPQCRGLELSEVLTYYDTEKSEQFIELYNGTDEGMTLDGCTVKYKTKTLALAGELAAEGYMVLRPNDQGVTLTKNPTSTNNYEIIDATGDVLDTLALPHGQKKAMAYAQFGYDGEGENWLATYAPTPGAENVYQQYRSCPEGKVINESTGNCIKAATIASVQECPEGKYRNPLTGRCKKIEDDSELTPCKEGYERNPETNRCRKIRNNDGTDYPLVPKTATEQTTFIAGMAIGAVLLIGGVYILLQYRTDVGRLVRRHLPKRWQDKIEVRRQKKQEKRAEKQKSLKKV